ncbi:sporulation histidine kinase inhibitor Sda [Halobacillus salinarum]|uniref:Sporulation histidine kinase inhibitor Sda n=1 Tax=Halobacillus salinarum TaxID=2932257 RepID=A0ABY4EIJ3_9BACI|nr:sporulation histidine kinase inhibitor Sda [Halobacillus salinarum]UOQ43322.1 sporulation histidine kinase inhibitor Sda [Halobacillus salinarum]
MKELTNKDLIETFKTAHQLKLSEDFIELLNREIVRREITVPYDQYSSLNRKLFLYIPDRRNDTP